MNEFVMRVAAVDEIPNLEGARLVCRTVREIGRKPRLPGAIIVRCSDCNAEVWMSPSTRSAFVRGAKPTCVDCSKWIDEPISGFWMTPAMVDDLEEIRQRESAAAGVELVPTLDRDVVDAWLRNTR